MRKRIKKIKAIFICCLYAFCVCFIFGCSNDKPLNKKDNLVWTNESIVYAYINAGYEDNILKNVEASFQSFPFQKVYIAEKNLNDDTPLSLLFILEEGGAITQEEFICLLEQDKRINYANSWRDIPFETVDTRYIEKEKDTISVGETLKLTLMGNIDYYIQPFDFRGFYVKPMIEKQYNKQSFPGVTLKSIKETDNGWLYLELEEEGYFNVVEACDKISRLPTIEKVARDKGNVVSIIPPIWQVSNETVIRIETDSENYLSAIITGLKAGKTTVEYADVRCEIIVS